MISTFLLGDLTITRSLLTVAVVLAIAVAAALAAAGRSGRVGAGLLSLAGIAVVVSLTLSPMGSPVGRSTSCNLEPYNYVSDLPNVVLFLVPMIFTVIATRSPAVLLVLGPMASAAIEIAQYAMLELDRRCDVDDLLANSAGAVIGVAIGAAILGVERLARRRPPVSTESGPTGTAPRFAEYRG